MDRISKKQDQTGEKKAKDRGDLKKIFNKKITEDNTVKKISFADRGDSNTKAQQKTNAIKVNIEKKKLNDVTRLKNISNATIGKSTERSAEREGQKQAVSNLDIRRLIRERYTMRQKVIEGQTNRNDCKGFVKSDRAVNRSKKQLIEDTTHQKERLADTHTAENTSKKTEKETTPNRKPIIKTITSKNNPNRTFKSVTFGEQRNILKPLQITIPNETQKITKDADTVTLKTKTVSRVSVKEKSEIRKCIRKRVHKNRHGSSPDSFKICENKSPPTEVAKWAPCCVNRHTKPYYEAWVNTTLAAISRSSKKNELLLEKRSILQSFQRALEERSESPELVYEKLLDERYTGRIRVIHR